MDLGLKDKRVYISASSGGIGLATAKAFLAEGSRVIINGRDSDKLNGIYESLSDSEKEKALFFSGDMKREEDIIKATEYIKNVFDGLDILIANLGSGKPETSDYLDIKEWERFYDINVFSAVVLLQHMHSMLKNGNSPNVVFISSIVSKEACSAPIAYAASKSSVRTMSKYLSRQWSTDNIRVNCVLPGNVYFKGGRWEELQEADPKGVAQYIDSAVPMKRFGKPEEIADAILFLSSNRAKYITGSELVVDGGQLGVI